MSQSNRDYLEQIAKMLHVDLFYITDEMQEAGQKKLDEGNDSALSEAFWAMIKERMPYPITDEMRAAARKVIEYYKDPDPFTGKLEDSKISKDVDDEIALEVYGAMRCLEDPNLRSSLDLDEDD